MEQKLMRWPRASEALCTEAGVARWPEPGSLVPGLLCRQAPARTRLYRVLPEHLTYFGDGATRQQMMPPWKLPLYQACPARTSASVPTTWSAWPSLGLKDSKATATCTTSV